MSSSPDSFETKVRVTLDADGVATEAQASATKVDGLTGSLERSGTAADGAKGKLTATAASVAAIGTASQTSAAQMASLSSSLKNLNQMGSAGSGGKVEGPILSARELAMVQDETHNKRLAAIDAEKIAENEKHQDNLAKIRKTGSADGKLADMKKANIQAAVQAENQRHKRELSNIADKKTAANAENRTRSIEIKRVALEEQKGAEQVAAAKKAASEKAKAAAAQELAERKKQLEIEKQIAAQKRYAATRTNIGSVNIPTSNYAVAGVGVTPQASSQVALLNQKTQELNRTQERNLRGLSNARYALYDVAATWRMVGIAATGASAAMVATAASFESAFTGVERTVDVPVEQMGKIRDDLISLSASIPESFPDLSNIATIGGQLDIAGSNIVGFTENVAKFSAMTDASIDDTAMSFGRIDQLANDGIGSFQSIASAIYDVGVQTVATETQIMKMSQEISATASLAGFTAQEVIGLSGALASLGVQPERARGAIQKSFALISTAVDEGGADLVKFADVANMSADEFASAWGSEPANVFKTFLTGLSSIQNLDTALVDLGLNDLRVADMFKRLSGNMKVVNQAMDVSANAWTDHSAFMEAYGLVADDLASKMKMLSNDLLAFIDSITDTAVLGGFVDQIRNVVMAVQGIADGIKQIPVIGKVFGSAIPMVLGLVGAMALLKAGQLTLRASAYAMLTAQAHMSKNAEFANMKYMDLIRTLFGLDGASKKAATSETALAASTQNAGNAAAVASGKWSAASVAIGRVATSAQIGAKAVYGLLGGWQGLAGIAVVGALSLWGKHMNDTRQEAEALAQSFKGVSEAIMQDTATYERTGEALKLIELNSNGVIVSIDGVNTSHGAAYQSLISVAEQLGITTTAWDTYTIAISANTQEVLLNAIRGNDAFKNTLVDAIPAMENYGITLEEVLDAIATGNVDALKEKFYEIEVAADKAFGVAAERAGTLGEGFKGTAEDGTAAHNMIELLESSSLIFSDTLRDLALDTLAANEGLGQMAETGYDTEESIYSASNAMSELANSMIAALEGPMAFEQAMYSLGQSLAENGNDFDIMSESGRANMSALAGVVNAATVSAGNDVNALAKMLAQAARAIGAQGVNIVAKFQELAQGALNNAAKAAGVAAPQFGKVLAGAMDNQSFAAGYNAKMNDRAAKSAGGAGRGARDAGKGAAAAAKEIRTLTDYVKDLSSVMKNAFEFRWGLEKSIDSAADAFQKLQDMKTDALERVQDAFDKFEDSEQKIKDLRIALADLQADINGLSADKGTLEYQLKVARDYGDSLREKEILAKLEKVQSDMAKAESDRASKTTDLSRAERDQVKASKELGDAQRDVKRDLSGTTASSREQRSAVLALVSSYQDQVEQLANSGLSSQQLAIETEKLRQKFVAQMLQLGYSRAEAEKYSQSFRDMTTVINNIPRNITINANTNPAQRAIDEFRAKNTNGRGLSAPINVPVGVSTAGLGSMNYQGEKLRRYNEYLKAAALYQQALNPYNPQLAASRSSVMSAAYNAWKNYYGGGYTGAGGKYEVKGLVHGGEFVFRKDQVDQSTGLPYISAIGDILAGSRSSGGGNGGSGSRFPSVMVVELSPVDRKLIQDSGHAIIALDGKVLASSVNSRNANTSGRGL